jgi:D-alanyl-lipoteichoic acid acyltransferase DltB (MBOAT superfamily)
MVDVYWEKIPAERRFIDFATYVAFFPQIVAGPIQRSGDFLEQIRNLSPGPDMIRSGLGRLLLGCFKKAVIADNLSSFIGLAYSPPHGSVVGSTLPAFYLFPLQLYADFSALTDIAIDVDRLFRLQSPENFNSPTSTTNISDFGCAGI